MVQMRELSGKANNFPRKVDSVVKQLSTRLRRLPASRRVEVEFEDASYEGIGSKKNSPSRSEELRSAQRN